MKAQIFVFVLSAYFYALNAEVYLEEKFQDGKLRGGFERVIAGTGSSGKLLIFLFSDSWEKTWVYSKHPGKEFGKFAWTAGKFFNNAEDDKGNRGSWW